MTRREELHQLVDELPEEQSELARVWLQDLRDAADDDGPPLDAEALASLDRGLARSCGGSCEASRRIRARTRPVSFRVNVTPSGRFWEP